MKNIFDQSNYYFKYLVIQNGDLINLIIKNLNKLPFREASLLFSKVKNTFNCSGPSQLDSTNIELLIRAEPF